MKETWQNCVMRVHAEGKKNGKKGMKGGEYMLGDAMKDASIEFKKNKTSEPAAEPATEPASAEPAAAEVVAPVVKPTRKSNKSRKVSKSKKARKSSKSRKH